ncbi:MAG: trypsin-like peptidase domain-containing protein [Caldilineaceae bacterium]|nr:trypsin-like peptidase domain-containing protein [Caldilineaceae bacterium]
MTRRLHADHSPIGGPERRELFDLLLDAYPVPADLANTLRNRRNIFLARIATVSGTYEQQIYDVIDNAESRSWSAELVEAALLDRPFHVGLQRFAQRYGLTPSFGEAERTVNARLPELPARWFDDGLNALLKVCRIELPHTPVRGTGFLVGPNLLLTNFHVMQDVIRDDFPAALVKLHFDRLMRPGSELQAETARLHPAEWLVRQSPDAPDGWESSATDALDYVLLQTETLPGETLVDAETGRKRGWLPVTPNPVGPAEGDALLVFSHPLGNDLAFTLDTNAVIGVNKTGTRIRYRTNTQHGSSGAPCFDLLWNPLALHHKGFDLFNEGILLSAVYRSWTHALSAEPLAPWRRTLLEQLTVPDFGV